MKLETIVKLIIARLAQYQPELRTSWTGSFYIHFHGNSRIKTVRVSDHGGHKLHGKEMEIRSDVKTSVNDRVYNVLDYNQAIKNFR